MNKKFSIEKFRNLPGVLKSSDYVDMLLFLSGNKPCVRLGQNKQFVYSKMEEWCEKYGYAYLISNEQLMYIANKKIIAKITQLVDDSTIPHAMLLGFFLGYPSCCSRKISKIGEMNIDSFEQKLFFRNNIDRPFNLINSTGYTKGYSFISHVPCCKNCKKSLRIANETFEIVKANKNELVMKKWVDFWGITDNCK